MAAEHAPKRPARGNRANISLVFSQSPKTATAPRQTTSIHWSMRVMSLVSLIALAIYTYVLRLCRHQARKNAANHALDPAHERRRVRLASTAFALDLFISAYFSAITPLLLKHGGLILDRKQMPRPLFWFFAITGFVPTASMTLTVIGGQRWQQRIRNHRSWHIFHGVTALLAYFSWWIACSPVIVMSIVGEEKVIAWAKENGLLQDR